MSDTRDDADCIVIRAKCCGRVIVAAVNEPRTVDAAFKRQIGESVAAGHTVEHRTARETRTLPFGCHCKASR